MHTDHDHLPGGATQAASAGNALARAADRHVLSELATGFAHEMNQPLAAIAAYAEGVATLLRRDPGHDHELRIIQAISLQALRAGDVVQQLRGAARPLPQANLPLDPNVLVRTVLPLLQSLAAQQRVRLTVELRTPSPPVHGDAARLQAMLILLFGGALDAVVRLPVARQRVTISTDDGASSVELSASEPQGMLFQVHLPRVDSGIPKAADI